MNYGGNIGGLYMDKNDVLLCCIVYFMIIFIIAITSFIW